MSKKKKNNSLIRIALILNLLLIKLCNSESGDDGDEADKINYCSTQACERESKNILKRLDTSVDACDDFYSHVCGTFIKETTIPDDKRNVDVSTELEERLKEQLNEILNQTIDENEIEPYKFSKKLYQACMNEALIEEQGLKPIKRLMDALGGWPVVEGKNWGSNIWSWQRVMLELGKRGFRTNNLFEWGIDADMKNSSRRAIYIDQMSLGMDREYLIKGFDDEFVSAYYSYAVDMAVIYGAERFNAELEMKDVVNFEIALANISIPKEERRNMTLQYNPIEIRNFQPLFPIHDWFKYFNMLILNSSITEDEIIILTDFQEIVEKLNELLKVTPNRVIVNHFFWHIAVQVADVLNEEVRNRRLQFSKIISGEQSLVKRWKECVDVTIGGFSHAISSLYVKNFFPKNSRQIATEMVEAIKIEFENILNATEWMDEVTKEAALEKVESMLTFIAYPDELMDDEKLIEFYKGITLDSDNYFDSVISIMKFERTKMIRKFRKPVNKTDWEQHADVAVINAYFNALENSIEVPAGILQGVYFSADRPKYLNYGAIGSIIGHEITHGFDDEGSQYDGEGNLVDWWQEDTKQAYLEKAQCIIDQYENFTEPTTGMHLNGINTQGENIADNGGMIVAYSAYRKYVQENGEEAPLPGLNYTSLQLFWVSAASQWCSVERVKSMKLNIDLDPHSPEQFRVNGPLSNIEEFARDFNCSPESKMISENKCRVW